jgi:hypothetical protein
MQTIKCVVVGDGAVGMRDKLVRNFFGILIEFSPRKNMFIN